MRSAQLCILQIRNVSPSLVNLVDLQFGFNRLASLRSSDAGDSTSDSPGVMLPKLERLNLESNELSDWPELVRELSCLPQCALSVRLNECVHASWDTG